jgi:hypothetical protein
MIYAKHSSLSLRTMKISIRSIASTHYPSIPRAKTGAMTARIRRHFLKRVLRFSRAVPAKLIEFDDTLYRQHTDLLSTGYPRLTLLVIRHAPQRMRTPLGYDKGEHHEHHNLHLPPLRQKPQSLDRNRGASREPSNQLPRRLRQCFRRRQHRLQYPLPALSQNPSW